MLFSVVVPVYRVEPYLRQCVDSILTQSFPEFELILVDDGSPDDCPAICDAYTLSDTRVRVIHQQNRGLSAARNAGIRAAAGDYVLLVDSDDYWPDREMLRHLKALIDEKSADVLLFRVKAWNEAENTSRVKSRPYRFEILDRFDHDDTLHYLLSEKQFPVGVYSLCVKTRFLQDAGIAFMDGMKSEDYDWILSVLRDSSRIYATDRILYVYRTDRPSSITHNIDASHLRDLLETASKWATAPGILNPTVRLDVQNYVAYIYSTALVVAGGFPKEQREKALQLLKQHRGALKGARWADLRLVRAATRLLGIPQTSALLQKLYRLK